MQKMILVVAIILVLLAIILGAYFLMSGPGGVGSLRLGQSNSKSFDVKGVKVEVLKKGSGEPAKTGDNVTVHYVGMLPDGTKFDSSVDRNAPFTFPLGQGRVIKGWDLGVDGMKVGEKRKLTIPPELGYGSVGFLSIPANATLVFEVEVLSIKQ